MNENPLVAKVSRLVEQTGLAARLVTARYDKVNFGNAEVVFEIDSVWMHFYRDRGQDFVEIGLKSDPQRYHVFDNVQIAMGWKSVDEVVCKKEPDALEYVLACVKINFEDLKAALASHPERFVKAGVDRAVRHGWFSPMPETH
jgi:hypothetical protein